MTDKKMLTAKMVLNGYTQRTLAKAVGMSKNTMCSKVNGKQTFNTDEIERICSVLHIRSGAEKAQIFLARPSQNRDAAT